MLKTYQSTVPVNSAAISPIYDHVLIGGGQEASQVTTTAAKAGRFEARFFHKASPRPKSDQLTATAWTGC